MKRKPEEMVWVVVNALDVPVYSTLWQQDAKDFKRMTETAARKLALKVPVLCVVPYVRER